MTKIPISAKVEEDKWKQMRKKTGKQTNSEIVNELIRIVDELESEPEANNESSDDDEEYTNLFYYPDGFIELFFRNRTTRGTTHEDNIKWVESWGPDKEQAEKILAVLYKFCRHSPMPIEKQKELLKQLGIADTPEPPIRTREKKKLLTSGHIEYFHKRYRQYKNNQKMLMEPDQDPPHRMVKDWFIQNGVHKRVADRFATELLEKYIPESVNGGNE